MSTSNVTTLQDPKLRRDLFIELVAWVLTTAVGALIGSLATQQPIKQLLSDVRFLIFIGIVTLLGGGLLHYALKTRALKRKLALLNDLTHTPENQFAKFNIQHIYPNQEACVPIIQEKIKSSSVIKFFLLLGSGFSGKSIAYLPAFHEKPASKAKVQILISAEDSPFLSENRLKSIKKDKADIRSRLHDVKNELNKLKKKMRNKDVAVNWQEHKETLLCAFHLFDDCVIFCFNIVTSENDKVSPYFVIQKNEGHSIYKAFEMYFDFVWSKSVKASK